MEPPLPAAPWPADLDPVAALVVRDLAAAPACVVAACVLQPTGFRVALGACGSLYPGGPRVSPTTPFDLASVTKPYTALIAARLPHLLATPLGALVDEARGTPSADVPVELLLAHRAGLDGHRPLYAPLLEGKPVDRSHSLREAALARRPGCDGPAPPGGFAPVYSDLGYLLAGEALARAADLPLDELMHREVIAFTGGSVGPARRLHDQGLAASVAPTEQVPFRGGVVQAAVHDENAWALGGLGVCGHAGLFGVASDVLALGALLLLALDGKRPDWLAPEALDPLLRPRHGGTLRAGFDSKSPEGSSAGALFGPRSFGHLGFTGTSLWIDPDRKLAAAVLTNRVHPTRAHDAIKRARPLAHDAIARWADGG